MVVMMVGIHISQKIFEIDVLAALKFSLEQRWKHVLRLLQLYGDQALGVRTGNCPRLFTFDQKYKSVNVKKNKKHLNQLHQLI